MSDPQAYPQPMFCVDQHLITLLGGLRDDMISYIGHCEDQGLPPKGTPDRELLALHTSGEWLRLRAIYAACDAIQMMIVRAPGWEEHAMLATTKQRQYIDKHQFITACQATIMAQRRSDHE